MHSSEVKKTAIPNTLRCVECIQQYPTLGDSNFILDGSYEYFYFSLKGGINNNTH